MEDRKTTRTGIEEFGPDKGPIIPIGRWTGHGADTGPENGRDTDLDTGFDLEPCAEEIWNGRRTRESYPKKGSKAKELSQSQSIAPRCRCKCVALGVAARCHSRFSMKALCLLFFGVCVSAPEDKPMAAKCLLSSLGVFKSNLATGKTKGSLSSPFRLVTRIVPTD